MNTLLTKAGLGMTLAATALSVAAPADAQRYRRYGHRGGGDAAAGAIIGGIVGLGLGAAIASNNRGRYYDRGYYDDGYYYNAPPRVIYRERRYAPPPRYYQRPYRGYYADPYYAPRYRGYYGW